MPSLEVLNGPEVGAKTPIAHDTFFIGRDPNNHLTLTDRTVSRKHAVINHLEGKYVLSDLKSLKGVLVNGVKKEEAVLEHGDEIAIGAVRLRYYGEGGLGRTMDHGLGTMGKKKKKYKIWVSSIFLLVVLATLYFLKKVPLTGRVDLKPLQQHYEKGIQYFNSHDLEGAKGEWERVLKMDPEKRTVYSRKAAKLLENL